MLLSPTFVFAADDKADPVMNVIKTRRSIRDFSGEPVSDKDIQTILEAAMFAPSAANEQPWDFIVIQDTNTLNKVGAINHYASYAKDAPVSILVCLNEDKEKIKGMGIIDVSMSAQNLMLAARDLGLGSVFTGIYPMQDRMKAFQELVGLPTNVLPIGLVVIGHPADPAQEKEVTDRFKTTNIHKEKWQGK